MKLFEINGANPAGTQTGPDSDALRQIVLAEMRAETPMIDALEFYAFVGSADTPRKNATATGGATRALNASYPANNTTPQFGALSLRIIGDTVRTDRAYERRGGDIGSERLRELRSFSRSLARYAVDQVFNGVIATTFSGFGELVDASMVSDFGGSANGTAVTLGSDNTAISSQKKLLEEIDELISETGATALAMPAKVRGRLVSIARDAVTVTAAADAIGQTVQLVQYNGVQLFVPGYNKDKSAQILTSTEVLGTSGAVCSSVWAFRSGEKTDLTYGSNQGITVYDRGLVESHYCTDVELDIDSELLDVKALGRLRGIIIS